jgi:RHS repeat-associated protein
MDMAGNTVVSYVYDSWGKQLSCTGSLANTLGTANPLRYRGYIYDEDSGLYYLQSRYYNPEWGRFLNADCNLSTAVFEFNGYFTYCMNNPVMFSDYSGFIAMCMNDDTDEGYKSFLRRRINETAIYSTRDKTNGIDNPVETIHIDNTNTYLQLYSIEEPLWQFYIASDIWHNYKSRTGDYYREEEGKIAFELYIHMAAYKLNFRVEQSRVTEIYAYETGFFQDVINYMYNRMDIRDTYRSIINSIER